MHVHTFIWHAYTEHCTRFRSRMLLKRRGQATADRHRRIAEYINAGPEPSSTTPLPDTAIFVRSRAVEDSE
jgi:hypothetical protein